MEKMIDKDFPEGLLTQAAESPSLRYNYDLRSLTHYNEC